MENGIGGWNKQDKRLKNQITAGRGAHSILTWDEDRTRLWCHYNLDRDAKFETGQIEHLYT